jgi:type II secretory pathway component GspD/PulD (secretin)
MDKQDMKRTLITSSLLALLLVAGCRPKETTDGERGVKGQSSVKEPPALSSFDTPRRNETSMPAGSVRFESAELAQVLKLYQEVSGRSIIRSPNVPDIKVTFENATPLTRVELLQALDNVLAANNIAMIYLGTKYVKAVPAAQAPQEPGPVVELPPDQLPESSSYLTYIVKLRNIPPEQAIPIMQPFAKLPNSIVGTKGESILILRDYSANVKRMLKVLEEVENAPRPPSWLPGNKASGK